MYYDSRNRENISKLAYNTQLVALKWYEYCVKNNINILIYETIRTKAQQKENVSKGASQTMKSYHIVGQALDFVPVNDKGQTLWSGYEASNVKKAISYAKSLGFEWGGDWKSFVDKPHLQFNYKGYGSDILGKKVEVSKKEEFKLSKVQQKAVDRVAKELGITDAANLDKTMIKADILVLFDRMLDVLEDKRGGYDYKLLKEEK